MRLRGLAVVELEQTAESLTTLHLACSDDRHFGRDPRVAQALVRPFFMIMLDKFSDGHSEMPFAEQHHSVQALGVGRFDKAFRKRVQIRTPRREDQGLHATVAQQAPKGGRVERIAIEDDVLHVAQEAIAGGGQVPSDLRHPGLVRLICDPSDLHGARLQLHNEEDDVADQAAQGEDLDGEKVRRCKAVPMRGEKRLPGGLRATLRRGLDAVVLEDRLDRIAGDVVTETLEPTADARVAPGRVSFAMRITSAARSGLVLGRPRRCAFELSYFLATSVRYHRKMVSGVTMRAMAASRRRPRTLPFTAKRRRWSSVRHSPRGPCAARRTRFSSSR
jgi:hypothetical protein